jgi:hypothetical protein
VEKMKKLKKYIKDKFDAVESIEGMVVVVSYDFYNAMATDPTLKSILDITKLSEHLKEGIYAFLYEVPVFIDKNAKEDLVLRKGVIEFMGDGIVNQRGIDDLSLDNRSKIDKLLGDIENSCNQVRLLLDQGV